MLEDPWRDAWQKPHEVVMALGLKPTDTVADIARAPAISRAASPCTPSRSTPSISTRSCSAIASSKTPMNLQTIFCRTLITRFCLDGQWNSYLLCACSSPLALLRTIQNSPMY